MFYRITYKTDRGLLFYKEVEASSKSQAQSYTYKHKNRVVGGLVKVAVEPMSETGRIVKLKKKRRT